MLASFPASMVNQKRVDLGIPNRFGLISSRFRRTAFRYCSVDRQSVYDGHDIMGVSTWAPIYTELGGKRFAGAITFNGRELVIEKIA